MGMIDEHMKGNQTQSFLSSPHSQELVDNEHIKAAVSHDAKASAEYAKGDSLWRERMKPDDRDEAYDHYRVAAGHEGVAAEHGVAVGLIPDRGYHSTMNDYHEKLDDAADKGKAWESGDATPSGKNIWRDDDEEPA